MASINIESEIATGVNVSVTFILGGSSILIIYAYVNEDGQGNSEQIPDSTRSLELPISDLLNIEQRILEIENLTKK